MRHSPASERGHATSQRTFRPSRGDASSLAISSGSYVRPRLIRRIHSHLLSPAPKGHDPTSLVTSSQVPAQSSSQQPRLQWPDQEQPSMIDTDSHHISSSNPVWDQRYLSNWNTPSTTGGTGSSESPSRSLSHSSESYSPAPHAFVPPYPSPLGRGRTRAQDHISQPHPDEPPYVKRRRVTVGSSSSTSTAPSSNRRFYNFNDRTRSTAVGSSGSMMITFPVESGSSGPNQSHVASDLRGPLVVQPPSQILHPAGLLPDDFEHGPTELPPRPYPRPTAPSSPPGGSCATPVGSKDGDSSKENTRRRKPHLPDDVMDYVSLLSSPFCISFWLEPGYYKFRLPDTAFVPLLRSLLATDTRGPFKQDRARRQRLHRLSPTTSDREIAPTSCPART